MSSAQDSTETPNAVSHHELELKLVGDDTLTESDVVAHIEPLAELGPPDLVEQTDRYYDTPGHALLRAGLAARCRSAGPKRSIQIKPVPIIRELVMDREEVALRLEPGAEPGPAVRALVESTWPITLDADPVEQVEIHNARTRYEITGSDFVAELCFDDVRVGDESSTGDHRFREIEVELLSGDELPFRAFATSLLRDLGLRPSKKSKYQRALHMLGRPGYSYHVDRPKPAPDDPTKDAARALLGWQLDRMLRFESGTRVGADLEHLHKMRVTSRRIRNSLRVFRKALKRHRYRDLSRGFKWLGGVLGGVRDLDVHQVAVRPWREALGADPAEGWAHLSTALYERWEAARRTLIEGLDSPRYAELIAMAERTFKRGKGWRSKAAATRPISETAKRALEKCHRQFEDAVALCLETRAADDIHEARIAGKRVRYTTDLFKTLLDANVSTELSNLRAFQDTLGDIQDAAQALLLVDELREESEHEAYRTVLDRIEADCTAAVETAPERVVEAAKSVGIKR